MYVIANGAILKGKNVCKILVELYSAILVRFSIFSIQVVLIVPIRVSNHKYGVQEYSTGSCTCIRYSCVKGDVFQLCNKSVDRRLISRRGVEDQLAIHSHQSSKRVFFLNIFYHMRKVELDNEHVAQKYASQRGLLSPNLALRSSLLSEASQWPVFFTRIATCSYSWKSVAQHGLYFSISCLFFSDIYPPSCMH